MLIIIEEGISKEEMAAEREGSVPKLLAHQENERILMVAVHHVEKGKDVEGDVGEDLDEKIIQVNCIVIVVNSIIIRSSRIEVVRRISTNLRVVVVGSVSIIVILTSSIAILILVIGTNVNVMIFITEIDDMMEDMRGTENENVVEAVVVA